MTGRDVPAGGTARALLRAELLRLRSRRAVVLLLLAAVLAPLAIAVGLVVSTTPPSDAGRAQAQAQADAQAALPSTQRELERCESRPGRYGVDPEAGAAEVTRLCTDVVVPQAEWFLAVSPLDLESERDFGSGLAVVVVLGAVAFLIGTTFAGHDWSTGSMTNQLLFEPRRVRVWAAKVAAVGVVSAVVGLVVLTAYWLGLAGVLATRGDPPPGAVLLDCLQHGWRGALLVTVGGLGGVILTMLSRSTVFSLGVLFGVTVAGGLLLATLGPDDPGPVDPTVNALAVLQDGTTYYAEVPERCQLEYGTLVRGQGDECNPERVRTFTEGATWYAGLVVLVGAASALSFRRRDVA